jgi:uncharacterized membrane protein (DUF485 family)
MLGYQKYPILIEFNPWNLSHPLSANIERGFGGLFGLARIYV